MTDWELDDDGYKSRPQNGDPVGGDFDDIVVDEDFERLEKAVQELVERFAEFNNKLTNMANKLEEHMKEPDAHNPAMLYKK